MKKLILILFALLAISTTAQTTPSYPTVKLTKLATGGSTDDILTIGSSSKTINKVSKASLLSGLATTTYVNAADATKEPVITEGTTSEYWSGDKTWQTLDKTAVGLGNVDNTSDVNKPISTATQTALDAKQGTLVSGTSLKTINGNSLLGSGDIIISGGGSYVDLTTNQTIGGIKYFSADVYFNGIKVGATNSIRNTTVGYQSLISNTTGQSNTSIGYQTLKANTTGTGNIAVGATSLLTNTTGSYNIGIGGLTYNTTGSYNIGINGLGSNTTGSYNITLGGLSNNTTSDANTSIGYQSLGRNTTGNYNVSLGYEAGIYTSVYGTSNSTGVGSVFIGAQTSPLSDSQFNQIVIGYGATGAGSNTVTLGNTSIVKTILRGTINVAGLPTYADNAAAIIGGLIVGDMYRTSTGVLMVIY